MVLVSPMIVFSCVRTYKYHGFTFRVNQITIVSSLGFSICSCSKRYLAHPTCYTLQESRKSKHHRLWHFLPRIIPQDMITKQERNQRNASPYHIHDIVRENNFDPWCLLSRGSCICALYSKIPHVRSVLKLTPCRFLIMLKLKTDGTCLILHAELFCRVIQNTFKFVFKCLLCKYFGSIGKKKYFGWIGKNYCLHDLCSLMKLLVPL